MIEIIAELAHALALLPHCHDTIMAIYNRDRGRYFAAAQKCPERRNPAISCGRAEHQIMSLRALGIIAEGDPQDVNRILRAADRKLYDALASIEPGTQIIVDDYIYTREERENPDTFYARAVVGMGICATRHLIALPSQLTELLLSHIDGRKDRAAYRQRRGRDEAAIRAMKDRIGVSAAKGITGLYDDTTDAVRDQMDRILRVLNAEGIDVGEYTSGVLLTPLDAEALTDRCDAQETISTSIILLMARAIKMDRDFCLAMYREDKSAEADAAKKEAADAISSQRAAEKRCSELQARIIDLERERAALEKALADHDGDASELAALRGAVYAAGRDPEQIVDDEHRREIPDGIIAIGGHPKWAALLREATGIRIWPVGTTCPPSVIAAATEVWIQAAYMDHSSFYAAIDAARRANVPVRYYSGTGVATCVADLKGGI